MGKNCFLCSGKNGQMFWTYSNRTSSVTLFFRAILFLSLASHFMEVSALKPRCRINCGVLSENKGPLIRFVESIWKNDLEKQLPPFLDLHFVPIEERSRMTLTEIYDSYLEMGTYNISAVLGRFMQAVATASEKVAIPYFITSEVEERCMQPYNVFAVFPDPSELYKIAIDVVRKYSWRNLAVFYDISEGVQLIEDLVQLPDIHVRSWKIDSTVGTQTLRDYLLKVRQLLITEIIVMSNRAVTAKILEQALHLSMLSSRYSWILPSLDQDEQNLAIYSYTQVNMTIFHMSQRPYHDINHGFVSSDYAKIYDSLRALYHSIRMHHRNTGSCYWLGREFLLPTLSKVSDVGATGRLAFRREDGSRNGFVVNILSLGQNGMEQIGLYNSSITEAENRLVINGTAELKRPTTLEYPLGKDVVKIVTILEDPFVRLREGYEDQFEGFLIDLLEEIAREVGFRYRLYLVPDGQYGDENPDHSWSGILGQIINANASMAVAPLTINTDREKVIDFTTPFKTFGIGMIMKKPEKGDTFFQFLDPLSPIVWLMLGGVLVMVSLTLYMMDHLTPPPDPTIRFDALESIWFTFSSMVVSGTDVIPRTVSGRILAASLWFFSLIIISSYTANLAAFLTVSKFHTNIKSVTDLLGQNEVHYGTVRHSEVSNFFKNSKLNNFQQMWQIMSTLNPQGMVQNASAGFAKVRESNSDYAFLFDAPMIEHKVYTDCTLMEVGKAFDSRSYGIAVPRGARYRDDLSIAILKLGEEGKIHQLEAKWWDNSLCPPPDKVLPSTTQSLTMHKVGGVFVILAVGIVVSLAACVIDYFFRMRQRKKKAKNRKIAETNSSDSHNMDGKLLAPTVQIEETYIPNSNANPGSKHTNIF